MTEAAPQVRYEISIRGRLSETLLAAFPTMHAQAQGAETITISIESVAVRRG